MVKPLKLSTLNGRLECIVNNVGASENPKSSVEQTKMEKEWEVYESK